MTQAKTKAASLSEKMKKLEDISSFFEGQDIDIDEALKKYEEGVKLASEIKKQLQAYDLKIKEIKATYSLAGLKDDAEEEPSEDVDVNDDGVNDDDGFGF